MGLSNEILQYAAVSVILVCCLVWLARRIFRRKGSCGCDANEKCSGCPLSDGCRSGSKGKRTRKCGCDKD